MARRVFFSFHYERDVWRANQVRNSWVTRDREAAGFWDASLWEESKTKGEAALKKLIDEAMVGTSVTVVLIGAETANRFYCNYEITQSNKLGKGMIGVYIHNLNDKDGKTDPEGSNPFDKLRTTVNGRATFFSTLYRTYYWFGDKGYEKFATWVEAAAKDAGR